MQRVLITHVYNDNRRSKINGFGRLGVSGRISRQQSPCLHPDGSTKSDAMVTDGSLKLAYANEGTRIYQVTSQ